MGVSVGMGVTVGCIGGGVLVGKAVGDGAGVKVGIGVLVAISGIGGSVASPARRDAGEGITPEPAISTPRILKGIAHRQLKIKRPPQPMSNCPGSPPLQVRLRVSNLRASLSQIRRDRPNEKRHPRDRCSVPSLRNQVEAGNMAIGRRSINLVR
jgi:hypothetical protein